MRICALAVPGVLALLAVLALAACEKAPPAPKPDDTPAVQPITPTASAAVATPSATTSAAVEPPIPSATAAAAIDAGKAGQTLAATAKHAGGAAKPASSHVTGKNFDLDVASPGCKAGEDCTMTIRLSPGGAFHVNKEYPYKFIATPAANVTFLGKSDPNTFTRAAGDFVEQSEKAATMTVRFKPASAGDAHVAGKYKLSVCSADQCQIEEAMIDLPLSVM